MNSLSLNLTKWPQIRLLVFFGIMLLMMLGLLLPLTSAEANLLATSLVIDKQTNKDSVEPGEQVNFTIRYRCASLTDHCLNAEITDALPAGMEIVNYTNLGGLVNSASDDGSNITWTLQSPNSPAGQLDAGSTGLVRVIARFPACDGGAMAGSYTNQATLTADGASPASSSADVTLETDVPTCPGAPAVTNDLIKEVEDVRSTSGGLMEHDLTFPTSASSYTITDVLPAEYVVTRIDRESDDGLTNMQLEIECANSGTWHVALPAGAGSSDFDELADIPAGADECVALVSDTSGSGYIFNVTAIRWTVPASGVAFEINDAIRLMLPEENPFENITVDLPGGGTGPALPNWTEAVIDSTIINCVQSSDNTMGDSGEACASFEVIEQGPAPLLNKDVVGSPEATFPDQAGHWPDVSLNPDANPPITQEPSDMIYGIEIGNTRYMLSWEDPVIIEYLDPNLEYISSLTSSNWWFVEIENNTGLDATLDPFNNAACHNPTFSMVENFNNSGRTVLRWDFSGCTLPGAVAGTPVIYLYFSARIKSSTMAGTEIENMAMATVPTNATLLDCRNNGPHQSENTAYWADEVDFIDFDGDGDTIEQLCKSPVREYTVQAITDLQSSKWGQGVFDTELTRYPLVGSTNTTGQASYEQYIEHTGNVTVTQLDVVDFLPFSGDSSTLDLTDARQSEWGMQLSGDLTIERSSDGGVTWTSVPASDLLNGAPMYATSNTPCRFENNPSNNADLSVTGTFPSGCTSLAAGSAAGALSFGFRFSPVVPFAPGELLKITTPVELNGNPPGCDDPACVGDTIDNGAIAWNSFGFGGLYDNSGTPARFLDTEPLKAGIRMIDTSNFTSLGNYIWDDTDGDGIQDATESPLVGVTVSLYDNNMITPTLQTTTDANGFYRFYGLNPNDSYTITLDNPYDYNGGVLSNYSLTQADAAGSNDTNDSDATIGSNGYPTIVATTGNVTGVDNASDPTEYPTNDFGFWQPASLGNYVWYDLDGFGDQNEDIPVLNATVTLMAPGADGQIGGGDDTALSVTQTDATGHYLFENLSPGAYYLIFDSSTITGTHPITPSQTVDPADWNFTVADSTGDNSNDSDVSSTTGQTVIIYLSTGENDLTWDAGLQPAPTPTNPVSVGNYVWEDINSNGQQDVGELSIPNVQVDLLDASGFAIATTFTDGDGKYQFDNLEDGNTYQLRFTPPDGTSFTTADSGTDDTDDSDANITSGETITFTLQPNAGGLDADPEATSTFDPRWDAGLTTTLSLGNLVWNDANNNGQYDSGETGISGLTVNLLDSTGTTTVLTTTTDANGKYLFTGLSADDYIVEVEIPSGMVSSTDIGSSTTPNSGTDGDDNGITQNATFMRSDVITLEHGGGNWGESDHGQAINGVSDSTLDRNADYTLDFGFFTTVEIGNRVWIENDNDGDATTGSITPVVGTIVSATSNTGTVYTGTTDANGFYTITLPANNTYTVTLSTPSGTSPSVPTGGLITSDNDPSSNDNISHDSTGTLVTVGTVDNLTIDFGFYYTTGAIGNYIWLDENSDGMQDAGEVGIPNVIVNLTDSSGTVYTTTTDAQGGYLFSGLASDTYTVTIPALNSGGALSGMTQTTTYPNPGADLNNQNLNGDSGYVITLGAGEENLTADFGYNYNPTDDVTNPTGSPTAALGDRIWVDVDGDGVQDPNEVGVEGVTVNLYSDPDGDGIYDTPAGSTTTDANGNYLFDSLTPAGYVVEVVTTGSPVDGWTQTGDPDEFGSTASSPDNRTTSPIVLAPGDVFLNADFGYTPPALATGSIGDTVWFDADASGTTTVDAGEYGIAGVTVVLIKDSNGDGIWTPLGADGLPGTADDEPIIGSDTTDAGGSYLFSGLPLDDDGGDNDADYLVWVNDTNNVLGSLVQTYDADGTATPDISAIAISSGTPDALNQDFSYTPQNHVSGQGLIGDTIFLDYDGSGTPDDGEGLEGVTVTLTDANGNIISTITDENGHYWFGNLDPNGIYTVTVDTNTLPGGLTNSVDPDGGNDSISVVAVSADTDGVNDPDGVNNGINLGQDFGYVATTPHRLGNLVWTDLDADGTYEPADGETPIGGVTVDLYRDLNGNGVVDAGEPLMGTTVTSASIDAGIYGTDGNYIFEGLPDGDYIVDVTDVDGILAGYWHSDGPNDGNNNNSQVDPYAVTINGADNLTADFGYYVLPAAVGNYVWYDEDPDGLQDSDEVGISGISVTLTISYPNNDPITLVTTTDSDGHYSFDNLLLDEDYNDAGSGQEPTYSISVGIPTGYTATTVDDPNATGDRDDSDNHSGVNALPVQGQTDVLAVNPVTNEPLIASYDFGLISTLDYGDLPASYSATQLGEDGPRHTVGSLHLGALVDADGDGSPDDSATGDDDADGTDDEDGLIPTNGIRWQVGTGGASIDVSVTGTGGVLSLWIDWNQDGDFDEANERVLLDESVTAGNQTITFDVPNGVSFNGDLNLRARLYDATTDGTASPIGYSGGVGEVEDYQWNFAVLSVNLASFQATCQSSQVMISWESTSELDNLGFNVYRSSTPDGPELQINDRLIPAQRPGTGGGAYYELIDNDIEEGTTYYYWIEDLDTGGTTTRHGPVSTCGMVQIYLPVIQR